MFLESTREGFGMGRRRAIREVISADSGERVRSVRRVWRTTASKRWKWAEVRWMSWMSLAATSRRS